MRTIRDADSSSPLGSIRIFMISPVQAACQVTCSTEETEENSIAIYEP